MAGPSAPDLAGRFRQFAATYPHLPLYSRLATAAADDPAAWSLLTSARPGQDRPVLWFAALHDLVLRSPSVPAAPWFASAPSLGPDDDPWPDVRATVLAHAADLRSTIARRSTQTNEVNRSVYVAALLVAAARDVASPVSPVSPVSLVELGASAGLLLGVDRYRVEVGPSVLGDPSSPVTCAGDLRSGALEAGPAGGAELPPIVERVGLDAAPVSLADEDEVRWLEACLWPDQPERLERFRAAVALLRPDPPRVVAGDMVDDLPALLATTRPDTHLVVMSTWALTYVRRDRRPAIADALAAVAASGRPVSWITAEPPGAVPGVDPSALDGETVLALRPWRHGTELPAQVVGVSHPHAPWLHLL